MKAKARLKITLACNRDCPYCINKCAEYRERWQDVSMDDVKWGTFRSVVISGGEPTMDIRLRSIARHIRIYTDGRMLVYLQTNGYKLTKNLVRDMDDDIDGIGLSVHNFDEFLHMRARWEDILRIKPVRLYVEEIMFADRKPAFMEMVGKGFGIRVWKAGESDPDEVVFLLKKGSEY